MSTLAKRLKDARIRANLSQEKLGIEAGLEPASASTRMNRYELGKRAPDAELVERLGEVLGVPPAYFYASDNDVAELLVGFHKLTKSERNQVMQYVGDLVTKSKSGK
jgi:transcriptional regulator with XRE-family HTH domain